MKIKKYTAPTMPEAMKQVRKELGADAVILQSRETKKGGFLGIFQKNYIEVVAALDPSPVNIQQKQPDLKPKEHLHMPVSHSNEDVLTEIKNLKKLISLSHESGEAFPAEYELMYRYLLEQDISTDLSRSIMENVIHKHSDEAEADTDRVVALTKQELETQLKQLSFEGITFNKQVIQFVGPTGVGKTTTLAKVAAKAMMSHGKKVAFITADTYRIAAVDQLKTYARILNVPVKVVYDMHEYRNAIKSFHDYDLIFVDTAGRNFQSKRYVQELKNTIDFNDLIDTYLVLSMTSKPKDMLSVYEQFSHLPIKGLVYTKADETRQFGSLLNIALPHRLDIAYITNGQDVPEDILEPNAAYITQLIMEGCKDA
ncbi:Flagellar biosynthesis protein FlhF [Lentibacillus sp. JNUCC-1]|uniref:flagellar biosynthesis protein FlhF n=1 Tax=Lentibacillus sp. JNUCC-1 TaxID=2654513 RepID=UPI0012E7D518|nr:flagellar biosynthesis protein FlhF [Lentibacillus sp. JNUCC-1]MUV39943.1 Flagellar biosynthesis protein FlhF [Lentibacillus sp. JNUCC-1]